MRLTAVEQRREEAAEMLVDRLERREQALAALAVERADRAAQAIDGLGQLVALGGVAGEGGFELRELGLRDQIDRADPLAVGAELLVRRGFVLRAGDAVGV